jgi:SAM-dependent methyltransferase
MSHEPQSAKDLNRAQFGANASNYATSPVHAKGASLARMVELVEPQPTWHALDIATAAGHTAFAFAPHVSTVVASDLTPEMVALCAERAVELGHENVQTKLADAEALPFDDATFDLATCRIAPHHFPSPATFVSEVARVLSSGGTFAMVDNIVPNDEDVAVIYNDWERRRDPSHLQCLSMDEWTTLCADQGLDVRHAETAPKRMGFTFWVENMNVPVDDRPGLLNDLLGANDDVREFLRPAGSTQDDAEFFLTEGLIVATKA